MKKVLLLLGTVTVFVVAILFVFKNTPQKADSDDNLWEQNLGV